MQRSAIVWGSLLILVGGLLLLDRLGFIAIDNWLAFWPVLLIAFGLAFLLDGRHKPEDAADTAAEPTTEQLVMQLKGAESAEIAFQIGAGTLQMNSEVPPDQLLAGSFTGGVAYHATDQGEGRVLLTLRAPTNAPTEATTRLWSVGLNPDVPLAMRVESRTIAATLDLHEMKLTDIQVKAVAGQADITLPAAAGFTNVAVDAGAAEVVLRIPADVAASIDAGAANGNVVIDDRRFPRHETGYQSTEYDSADNRVHIVASVGTGSLIVS